MRLCQYLFQQALCWMINSRWTTRIIRWKFSSIHSSNNQFCCINTIYRYISIISEYIIDLHNNQLPVGLKAQLFEHFTGVAEVQVRVLFRSRGFTPCTLLPSVNKSADYTSKYHYYLILTIWFMGSTYSTFRLFRLEKIVSGSWDILFAWRYLRIN